MVQCVLFSAVISVEPNIGNRRLRVCDVFPATCNNLKH
jgi:hypothetical protein